MFISKLFGIQAILYQIHKAPQNGFILEICPQLHLDNGEIRYTEPLVNGGYLEDTRAYFMCNENDGYALDVDTSGQNYTDCQHSGIWSLPQCMFMCEIQD